MFSLRLLVLLCSAHCMLGQFLPYYTSTEGSSEETGSAPGPRSTSCACGWTNKQGRIVGGKQVLPNEFPLMVGIQQKWGGTFCGGSIISERHVLTAAHCTVGMKNKELRVVVGTHDVSRRGLNSATTQIIDVSHTVEHERYNSKTQFNDIAILVLKTPIRFNQFVGPVCLPTERTNLLDKYIKVIGWGYINHRTREQPDHLMKVNLKVVDMEYCKVFSRSGLHVNQNNQVCTFRHDKDSCNGDSGGPLVWRDPETNRLTQVALVSYGSPKCGVAKVPAVNTNVYDYVPWIKATVSATSRGAKLCQKV